MIAVDRPLAKIPGVDFPDSFSTWKTGVLASGRLPIIGIAGTRGKSTVVRILDAIFREAGQRTASWTDLGIEVRGRRQTGEIGPWSRVMTRVRTGTLDVAIQELDWATIHAVGLPTSVYPVVAVTTLCANNDACMIQDETRIAIRSFPKLLRAVDPTGAIVLNGEDYAIAGSEVALPSPAILVGIKRETPLVREHLVRGGTASWQQDGQLVIGTDVAQESLAVASALPFALHGQATFQLQNALMAASIARACGVSVPAIRAALRDMSLPASKLPGSFNAVWIAEVLAVVDRPTDPWFLRPILRSLAHRLTGRLIVVVGHQQHVGDDALLEIGRLLGRASTAIVVHSEDEHPDRARRFRSGVAQCEMPPVMVHVKTERQAVSRALRGLRPGDTLLVLSDYPAAVLATLRRAENNVRQGVDVRLGRDADHFLDVSNTTGTERPVPQTSEGR